MSKAASPPIGLSTPAVGPFEEVRHEHTVWEDTAAARVIAANEAFYGKINDKYELYESCTFDVYLQDILERDLDRIHSSFPSLGRTPHCLDCGGGTGNLALKVLARGWNVTVVDVSAEMLAILKEKARVRGHSPRLVHSSIERFLQETRDTYDLVAFSSVLHHLYSYTSIVQLAAAVVRREGIFYSNYDPVVPQSPFWTRAFDTLDIAVAKAIFDPSDVLPGIARRCLKALTRKDPLFRRKLITEADLAEYRAHTGVDDEKVKQLLRINGFAIVEHLRYLAGRTKAVRFLNERFRFLENFKIIARRIRDLSGL
jgi:ubiquinone/menaquinone biosynthesis C-methylase UbiE